MAIVIIGAGLSGLSAAIHLQKAGREVLVLEKNEKVGGRVQTDKKDGFLLDRGFQVLLTAYSEAMDLLDYKRLNLQAFDPGSIILHNGSSRIFADPLRSPSRLLASLVSGVAGPGDFCKVVCPAQGAPQRQT
ncbi:MAG: oleate hydratase [Bacteroidia bacterium]